MLGAFLALDFFLFYVFYELMLVPMFVLIGLCKAGGRYAAIKFVLYTLLGSVGLLISMIGLYTVNARDFVDQNEVRQRANELENSNSYLPAPRRKHASRYTFDFVTLSKVGRAVMLILNGQEDRLAGGTRPPMCPRRAMMGERSSSSPGVKPAEAIERLKSQPVCTKQFQYLLRPVPRLRGQGADRAAALVVAGRPRRAPTPISMILAGILLKLGGYGLIRVAFPICPWAASELAWWVGLIGVIGIVYGALVAMGQTDFKKYLPPSATWASSS